MEAGPEGIHCAISTVITLKPKDAFRSNYHASDILHFKGTLFIFKLKKQLKYLDLVQGIYPIFQGLLLCIVGNRCSHDA